MQHHLTEEQLVAHYYHDDDQPAAVEEHLRACTDCRAEDDALRRVLAAVAGAAVPERGEDYGSAVWTRLRWKLGSDRRRRRGWQSLVAAAAIAVAFFAGLLFNARQRQAITHLAESTTPRGVQDVAPVAATSRPQAPDRIMLVIVGDHLDDSERMLTELANADASHAFDATEEQKRAAELVATNRIYRQSAVRRGDARIAGVLSDIEPILVELSHAGKTLSPEELAAIQKRIETKGLLFKVRVLSAETDGGTTRPRRPAPAANSL